MTVIKRDGREATFDPALIARAVSKAMYSCSKEDNGESEAVARQAASKLSAKDVWKVEEIQDIVEESLMASGMHEVARSYILYRDKRNKARNSSSDSIISDIIAAKKNDVTRENANMNADTPAGMIMKIASEKSKEYVDAYLLSDLTKRFTDANLLHIHDKDYYPTKSLTCIQHPMDKLLKEGFKAGHGESRAAKRIETASILSAISLETVQNEMHGGQSIPAFDFYLAPYVRMAYLEEVEKLEQLFGDLSEIKSLKFEDYIKKPVNRQLMSYAEIAQHCVNNTVDRVHQAMEAFIHNMNTIHSRGGNQVVFSSINYGTDTSAEGRCIIRELLLSTEQGVGNGATAIFPIHVWKKKRGVNYLPEDPNYDLYKLACRVTAKRFFPNFINLDATFNFHEGWKADDPERYQCEVATMGCRTRVFENRHGEKTSIARGNLSFSTVNLPGLALAVMDVKDKDERLQAFMAQLENVLDAASKQLLDRYKFQCTAKAKQFPLLMSGMWLDSDGLSPDSEVESVLKHGTLGIGFIGLAECLIALVGKHHGESEEAQKLGVSIISFMSERAKLYSERYNLNYSILATPAEGLAGKFTKKDRKKYGIVKGVTDKEYYTNSNHVPVSYKCSPTHKAKVEAPYHELTRGGHIFYVELDGDPTRNVEAVMQVVDLMDKHNMGYCSVNHNRNRCVACGYEDASKDLRRCPVCGSEDIDRLQRITGYLVGSTDRWNSAKYAELKDRVTHKN